MRTQILKSKKAGQSISVVLLTIAALLLVISILFVAGTRSADFQKKALSVNSIEALYSNASTIDFYLNRVIANMNKADPLNSFRDEMAALKNSKGEYPIREMAQIENQIDKEHVRIEKGYLKINFTMPLFDRVAIQTATSSSVFYEVNYNYRFNYSEKL